MPTLTYKLPVGCDNCGHEETISLPQGSTFIEYTIMLPQLKRPIAIDSGYHKNYNRVERKTIKRCSVCRCARLIKKGERGDVGAN